jgi:hypothetical protein
MAGIYDDIPVAETDEPTYTFALRAASPEAKWSEPAIDWGEVMADKHEHDKHEHDEQHEHVHAVAHSVAQIDEIHRMVLALWQHHMAEQTTVGQPGGPTAVMPAAANPPQQAHHGGQGFIAPQHPDFKIRAEPAKPKAKE